MTWSAPSSETGELDAATLEARLEDFLFAAPSNRSAARIARGLSALTREQQDWTLRWAGIAAQTYGELGYQLAQLAPQALQRLEREAAEAWVLAALAVFDRDGGRAAMDRLRDIDGFVQGRQRGDSTARFAALEARLARFVQALSGRPLQLAVAADGSAWTDTETLFLPPLLAAAEDAGSNANAYRLQVAMLWGQVRFGSFDTDPEPALARWRERRQGLAWLAVLEALRVESCIVRALPGLGAELAQARGPWPAGLAPWVSLLGAPQAGVADSLRLLEVLRRDGAEDQSPPALPFAGRLDPEQARQVRAGRIARASEILRHALKALAAGRQAETQQASGFELSRSADGMQIEVRLDGEVLALPPPARAAAQSLVQDLGELPPEALVPAGPGAWSPTSHEGSSALSPGQRPPDFLYDEWDHRRQAYRRDWCHLFEHAVAAGDPEYVPAVRRRHAALIARVRRRFEALRGGDRWLRRQPDGDEIDLDALISARADRRAGLAASADVHVRRQRDERSLAVMFMVDMSGSTRGWVNDAEREALVMLGEAVETLGDAWAVYGFSGWTRSRCDIYRIKHFAEGYDAGVAARIAAIEARDYTRMGVAIRHLSRLLAAQPARHRLLVTLSDGRPDDFADAYRSDYGIEDTRRALLEAQSRGIRSYCVTIDRSGADYLRRLYGPACFTVLDDVRKLPLQIADIYRRLAT